VKAEIVEKFASKYANIAEIAATVVDNVVGLAGKNPAELAKFGVAKNIIDDLENLICTLKKFSDANIVFDITVVRGQGYYTGMVFECYTNSGNFSRAIGGGGRYNKMLEKFLGTNVPAVGYSIGLEPVVMLLKESGKTATSKKVALVYPQNASLEEVFAKKQILLDRGLEVSAFADPKNFRNFCEKLKANNFSAIIKLADLDKIITL
jgi:histidyl-tRNA synthetase